MVTSIWVSFELFNGMRKEERPGKTVMARMACQFGNPGTDF